MMHKALSDMFNDRFSEWIAIDPEKNTATFTFQRGSIREVGINGGGPVELLRFAHEYIDHHFKERPFMSRHRAKVLIGEALEALHEERRDTGEDEYRRQLKQRDDAVFGMTLPAEKSDAPMVEETAEVNDG